MAFRRCPTCSSQIERSAPACPVCGAVTASVWIRWRRSSRIATRPAGLFLAATSGSANPSLPLSGGSGAADASPDTEPHPAPARHTKRRIAYWLMLLVLAGISVAAGLLTWRVIDTQRTVNSQSTPPPIVSGAALGGSPEVQIDSGPARTAVANAAASKTAAASAPQVTATEPPATATEPPVSTATPTAAPNEPTSTTTTGVVTTLDPTGTTEPAPAEPTATTEPAIDPTATSSGSGQMPPPPPLSTDTPTTEPPAEPSQAVTEPPAPDPTAPDLPATAPATIAIVPTSTSPADLPTVTATTAPLPSETSVPAATSEPVILSEIERIKNNSFEEGAEPWYIESGATVIQEPAARDGGSVLEVGAAGGYLDQRVFFVPGAEYYLTVSARVTTSGETAEFGVVFEDAEGTRLRDREPAPIVITETAFTTQQLIFTVPEDIAGLKIYAWKDDGQGALQIDTTSLRSVVPPVIEGTSAGEPLQLGDDSITILFMGVDARESEAIDGEVRPDSLMIVHLNPKSDSCRILSIPRDTRTDLPGYGMSKVNHALAIGGIEYEIEVVSQLTDLPIDHYVLIDFAGFRDLVDAIGGITIDVPEAFTAIDTTEFAAGIQEMDGKRALSYARHRGDSEGDFGRIERQQQVIRALVRETKGLEVVSSINELLPAVSDHLRTDLSIGQMIDLATTYRSICTEEAVTMLRLEGEVATFDDPLLQMPLSYVVIDEAEIRRKVAALLEP